MTQNKTPETKSAEWIEMKSKIKSRFGKLTDDTIEALKGSLEALPNTLRQVYGYGKDQSARELATFKATLEEPVAATEKTLTVASDVPTAPVADATKVA